MHASRARVISAAVALSRLSTMSLAASPTDAMPEKFPMSPCSSKLSTTSNGCLPEKAWND